MNGTVLVLRETIVELILQEETFLLEDLNNLQEIQDKFNKIQDLIAIRKKRIESLKSSLDCSQSQMDCQTNTVPTAEPVFQTERKRRGRPAKITSDKPQIFKHIDLAQTKEKRRGRPRKSDSVKIQVQSGKEKKRYLTQLRKDLIVKCVFDISKTHSDLDSLAYYKKIKDLNDDLIVHNFPRAFEGIMNELVELGFFVEFHGSEDDNLTEPKLCYRFLSGDFDVYQNRVSMAN